MIRLPNRARHRRLRAECRDAESRLASNWGELAGAAEDGKADLRRVAREHPFVCFAVVAGTTFLLARLLNRGVIASAIETGVRVLRAEGMAALSDLIRGNGR